MFCSLFFFFPFDKDFFVVFNCQHMDKGPIRPKEGLSILRTAVIHRAGADEPCSSLLCLDEGFFLHSNLTLWPWSCYLSFLYRQCHILAYFVWPRCGIIQPGAVSLCSLLQLVRVANDPWLLSAKTRVTLTMPLSIEDTYDDLTSVMKLSFANLTFRSPSWTVADWTVSGHILRNSCHSEVSVTMARARTQNIHHLLLFCWTCSVGPRHFCC